MRKYFPKNNKYHKIFNLNTLKLSYCCTKNLSSEMHKKASPCQCVSKRCDLCLIICADPDTLLNKRTELISRCRHRNKFLLANNCRGMVFNYLSQFLYKDTDQNWHILSCSFLWRTYGSCYLLFLLLIKFMDCIHENQLILSHGNYLQITSC